MAMIAALAVPCFADEAAPNSRVTGRDGEVRQRRPGPSEPLRYVPPPPDATKVPPPSPAAPRDTLPVPDRWRIMRSLGFVHPWYDPYD